MLVGQRVAVIVLVIIIVVDDRGDLGTRGGVVRGVFRPENQRVGPAGERHGAGVVEIAECDVAVAVGVIVVALGLGAGGTGMDAAGRQVALGRDCDDQKDSEAPRPDLAGVVSLASGTFIRGTADLAVARVISIAFIVAVRRLEGVEIVREVLPVDGPLLKVPVGDLRLVRILGLCLRRQDDRCEKEEESFHHHNCVAVGLATRAASWKTVPAGIVPRFLMRPAS